MSHLHFDHAGGLLARRRRAGVPARHDRRPARRVGDRARRQPAARRQLRPARAAAGPRLGRARAGPTASARSCPACRSCPTGGHSAGHQAIVVAGAGDGGRPLAFFGDLCMRPWSANPRWVTAFDDFPLDSVEVKASLFRQAADEDWTSSCPTSRATRRPARRAIAIASGRARLSDELGATRRGRMTYAADVTSGRHEFLPFGRWSSPRRGLGCRQTQTDRRTTGLSSADSQIRRRDAERLRSRH